MLNTLQRRLSLIAILSLVLVALGPTDLYCNADEEVVNYTTSKFNVEVFADIDNVTNYSESIVVNFNEASQTYTRQLPEETIGRVSNVNVDGYEFDFDDKTNIITIYLSEASAAGRKSFSIKYSIKGTESISGQKDRLDVYIIPDNWPTSIETVKIRFRYDANMSWDSIQYIIGDSRANTTEYGNWEEDSENYTVTFKGENLPARTGISINATFPEGYWLYNNNVGNLVQFACILFLIGIVIFIVIRLLFGKEREIEPADCKSLPREYMPINIAALMDETTSNTDISATLLEMAHRGYISIKESSKGVFEITYIKFPSKENRAIKTLFNGLFEGCSEYQTVTLDYTAKHFKKAAAKASREAARQWSGGRLGFTGASSVVNAIVLAVYSVLVFSLPFLNTFCRTNDETELTDAAILSLCVTAVLVFLVHKVCKFYRMNKSRKGDGNAIRLKIYAALYAVCAVAYSVIFRFSFNDSGGYIRIVCLSLAFLVIAPLMLINMHGRSREAVKLLSEVYGLKAWILNASKDEIKKYADENDDYFYELLPFSVILGITKKLIRDFEYVEVPLPDWYIQYGVDRGINMDAVILNSMIESFDTAVGKTLDE